MSVAPGLATLINESPGGLIENAIGCSAAAPRPASCGWCAGRGGGDLIRIAPRLRYNPQP
jgi:hypothetical protein